MLKLAHLFVPAALLAGVVAAPFAALGAIVENDQVSATSASAFAVSATDLINAGSPALAGTPVYTGEDSVGNVTYPGLTDGALTTTTITNDAYLGRTNSGVANPRTATYTFDTLLNPKGFDITQINTINGFTGTQDYSDQRYIVYVSFVGSPSVFHQLDDVTYYPFFPFDPAPSGSQPDSSSEVSLTDSTGILATGVAAIRFAYPFTYDPANPTTAGFEDGQLVQEIDVIGEATTPEPASLGIFAVLGGYGLFRRRRHA